MALDYRDLGKRIKAKREDRKMTQTELADKADLSTQHVSNVENARSKIGLEKLIDIANALDCSVEELICGSTVSGRVIYHNEIAEMIEDFSDIQLRASLQFLRDIKYFYKLAEDDIKRENQ